jgi:hypothetical protein
MVLVVSVGKRKTLAFETLNYSVVHWSGFQVWGLEHTEK